MSALLAIPRLNGTAILAALPFVAGKQRRESFRLDYIADGIYIIAANTGRLGGGEQLAKKYSEIVSDAGTQQDNKSAEEIVASVRQGLLQKKRGGDRV